MAVLNKFEDLKVEALEKSIEDKKTEKEIYQELIDKHYAMIKDRDAKCDAAKKQLIENLEITADKYRTATGTMEALRVLRMVAPECFDVQEEIAVAKGYAIEMSSVVNAMKDKAENLGWAEMDQLCDEFYEKEFDVKDTSINDLSIELMKIDLCRNVGPAAEDIVGFLDRANDDIRAVAEKMTDMVKENPEFADIVPTEFQEK